jgi:hypothetical protein
VVDQKEVDDLLVAIEEPVLDNLVKVYYGHIGSHVARMKETSSGPPELSPTFGLELKPGEFFSGFVEDGPLKPYLPQIEHVWGDLVRRIFQFALNHDSTSIESTQDGYSSEFSRGDTPIDENLTTFRVELNYDSEDGHPVDSIKYNKEIQAESLDDVYASGLVPIADSLDDGLMYPDMYVVLDILATHLQKARGNVDYDKSDSVSIERQWNSVKDLPVKPDDLPDKLKRPYVKTLVYHIRTVEDKPHQVQATFELEYSETHKEMIDFVVMK